VGIGVKRSEKVMIQKAVFVAAVVLLTAVAPASAQPRVEISGLVGWTFSDGVEGEPRLAVDGNIYDAVDVVDSFSWGFGIGVLATENAEVGFLYGRQESRLDVVGTNTFEVGDMAVSTYHGYFAYNFGPADAPVRPYVLGGLGATSYGSVAFTRAGVSGETGGDTQFSSTWGAGAKFFLAPGAGVRAGVRWTPTYIKSDPAGVWCDPWWGGCWVVGDAQYAHQFEFSGGVTFRF
jgi:Outer membrane protein beta-barrel domain